MSLSKSSQHRSKSIWYPGKLDDPTLVERFWQRVDRSGGPDACWPWTGYLDKGGYGQVRVNGKKELTHRVAFELIFGELPDDIFACHTCDNPSCCNPAHLFAGTALANARDMVNKGRSTHGEHNPKAKLSPDQVREIRARYAAGGIGLKKLAAMYGVHFYTISLIVNHKIWKDI